MAGDPNACSTFFTKQLAYSFYRETPFQLGMNQ